mmetsp:Transcript_3225/g.7545  ORF Transcript_3225/g.7545 Transcript_3225/m.7545 type:complete len:158 (-) Transcript_3225:126-599(-)
MPLLGLLLADLSSFLTEWLASEQGPFNKATSDHMASVQCPIQDSVITRRDSLRISPSASYRGGTCDEDTTVQWCRLPLLDSLFLRSVMEEKAILDMISHLDDTRSRSDNLPNRIHLLQTVSLAIVWCLSALTERYSNRIKTSVNPNVPRNVPFQTSP